MLKTMKFLAIVVMALALVPGGAHFFELPNKVGLGETEYFSVQQIYAGWALFGIVLFGALALNFTLAILLRGDRPAVYFAAAGFLAMAANLALFFIWTFPANQATANWTTVPENWEALRAQWEYSHAANALVTLLGFCSITLAALTARK
ncbi:MAG: DUF1772 domain-containing protein [Propylenella sp.]